MSIIFACAFCIILSVINIKKIAESLDYTNKMATTIIRFLCILLIATLTGYFSFRLKTSKKDYMTIVKANSASPSTLKSGISAVCARIYFGFLVLTTILYYSLGELFIRRKKRN